ncbi:MAG: NAD(+) synthase [Heliobacteriaceae bacterium]|jgi:NAD+ synthase (glutamine-hydrolysing)|nr:NAD(+) synthase [Heliobacteriaceae bacterium]
MKTALAQVRLKTGDFEFNFNSIIEAIDEADCADCDLTILPEIDPADLGAKDLCMDEYCRAEQENLYRRIADKASGKTVLLGNILIKGGMVLSSPDGFFEINGRKIFVSDEYHENEACDLYVLAKNRYFVMDSDLEFIESIHTKSDFVYVNAVCQADENIYAGGSFAKNPRNELVFQAPLCKKDVRVIDFTSAAVFEDEPVEQQIIDVTTFALREYCENTGFKRVILGLSGGIDSALTAALAVKALGAQNVLGILMPGMYSSQGSIDDALSLAQNLGIKTEKHPITPLFENFMEKIAHERCQDLAEENLQARLRALILMFFSNRNDRLLVSTGNKSESAMGYGTLYGDLAGGFNMIADLTKTNVYRAANYINKSGEVIPQATINKAPSAELSPGQKDNDSLPEYAVLDDIIEMYIEQSRPHEEIYEKYGKALVDDTIKRIYRAQFKRKQCGLGVRLTERSFCCGVNLPVAQRFYC